MQPINRMKIEFESKSVNESFARIVAAAFASQLDPTLEELADLKTAVSEAVTNAIIHGYEQKEGTIFMDCILYEDSITVIIEDHGVGIEDIEKARIPAFTSKPELERAGMGFSIMESFMDSLDIESQKGAGTKITMTKKFKKR
ncbi:MAG TPA: anti-sigma F factor [Ruminiclostridium sp.]|jgi:stage II sporulation protein AB (anti-sigma F factor)|nr:anti-sigma F factor [Clostridiaceae bacterium]HAA24519.1 anti-sigma F factor [Ruminiclostridium sp.]